MTRQNEDKPSEEARSTMEVDVAALAAEDAPRQRKPSIPRLDELDSKAVKSLGKQIVTVGTVVGGRYLLTEKLGAGGMGEVFRGENLAIRMPVAIKILKTEHL